MLTDKQRATAVLALGHLVQSIHARGNAPSQVEIERIKAVITKVKDEDQIEDNTELRALAIDAMEALVAEVH